MQFHGVYYMVVAIWFFHHTWSLVSPLCALIRNMVHKGKYGFWFTGLCWIEYKCIVFGLRLQFSGLSNGFCLINFWMFPLDYSFWSLQIYKAVGLVTRCDPEFVNCGIPQTLHSWCGCCMVTRFLYSLCSYIFLAYEISVSEFFIWLNNMVSTGTLLIWLYSLSTRNWQVRMSPFLLSISWSFWLGVAGPVVLTELLMQIYLTGQLHLCCYR